MSLALVQVVNLAAPASDLPVPWSRAAATGLVVVPTAFLLAALFVAIGSLARGFKEAQNLLVPVYFLFFAPAMLGALGDLPLIAGPGAGAGPERQPAGAGHRRSARPALGMTAAGAGGRPSPGGVVALLAAARLYVSERFLAADDERRPSARPAARAGPREDPPTAGRSPGPVRDRLPALLLRAHPAAAAATQSAGCSSRSGWGCSGWRCFTPCSPAAAWRPRCGLRLRRARRPGPGAALMALGGWMVANLMGQWLMPPPPEYIEAFRKTAVPRDDEARPGRSTCSCSRPDARRSARSCSFAA